MSIFVSIELPSFIKQELVRIQEKIKKLDDGPQGSYVKPENLHCTILFLGDREEVGTIKDKLATVSFPSFSISLNRISVSSSHRIVWIQINNQHLTDLAQLLKDLFPNGEERPFLGHITLLRIRKKIPRAHLLELLATIKLPELSFPVTHFYLQQSSSGPDGVSYTTIKAFPLTK